MNRHKNARLTLHCRKLAVHRVKRGRSVIEVAADFGVSTRTIYRWLKRNREGGVEALADRSSRPKVVRCAIPARQARQIEKLRLARNTLRQIADLVGVARTTIARLLKAKGLNRLPSLEPAKPVIRYERDRPGELIHIDMKKLGRIEAVGHRITGDPSRRVRGAGWEILHLAIDDHSRLAYTEILADEGKLCATAFLLRAMAWFAAHGIDVERVMTDNGSAYKSRLWRRACRALEVRHLRTRPYTPKTNGKAERFVQTSLREWAYAAAYPTSARRAAALPAFLHHYNHHRRHAGIGYKPPISRLPLTNVSGLNT